jgi:hypothetical protein
MEDFFAKMWEHLLGRLDGPLWIRIAIQPVLSSIIGFSTGVNDARAGRPPFVWTLLTKHLHRRELLKDAWRAMARIFIAATIIDVIYQVVVLRWIHPVQSLLVATVLTLVPYTLVRSATTQIIGFCLDRQARKKSLPMSRKKYLKL